MHGLSLTELIVIAIFILISCILFFNLGSLIVFMITMGCITLHKVK